MTQQSENAPKDLFQDIPVEQRARHLEDNAYKVEEGQIKFAFAPEEISYFKDQVANLSIELNDKQEELDAIKKEFKAEMQPKKDEVKQFLKNIRLKYREEKGIMYLMADRVSGQMHYYNSQGIYLESRRLMPSEQQGSIYQLKAAQQ